MLYLLKMCLLLPLLCVQCMSKIPLYVYNVHCLQVNSMYTMYIIYKLTGRSLSWRLIFAISETYNVWFAARNVRDNKALANLTNISRTRIKVVNSEVNSVKSLTKQHTMLFISDSFTASNLEMFSTFDNDNDKSKAKNCAVDMFSGWWYADHNACTEANLNGVHWPQLVNDKRGVTWVKWKGTWSLKETRMMIRKP